MLFQKQKAESALSFAESAVQAASARYSETKSRDDVHSLTQAAADLHVKTTNLEWQLRKIEDLQKGWVTLGKNYESRCTTDERDAVPHLLSQIASATETNPVLSATAAPAASSNPALSALPASEASAQPALSASVESAGSANPAWSAWVESPWVESAASADPAWFCSLEGNVAGAESGPPANVDLVLNFLAP